MRVQRSAPEDVPAVEALLTACGLPVDGAAAAFRHGVIAQGDDGSLLGSAAVELYGVDGLLRSVAVHPDARSAGVGSALVQAAQDLARGEGVTNLYLLTETAAPWFARLGWTPVDRSDVPIDVTTSLEYTVACPTSAVSMRLQL